MANVLLVEPVNLPPEVQAAIDRKSDPHFAQEAVSTPAEIRNKIAAAIANDGLMPSSNGYNICSMFSAASLYDIDGKKLINDDYSFICEARDQAGNVYYYLAKNDLNSPIMKYNPLDYSLVPAGQIDVTAISTDPMVIENAMKSAAAIPDLFVYDENPEEFAPESTAEVADSSMVASAVSGDNPDNGEYLFAVNNGPSDTEPVGSIDPTADLAAFAGGDVVSTTTPVSEEAQVENSTGTVEAIVSEEAQVENSTETVPNEETSPLEEIYGAAEETVTAESNDTPLEEGMPIVNEEKIDVIPKTTPEVVEEIEDETAKDDALKPVVPPSLNIGVASKEEAKGPEHVSAGDVFGALDVDGDGELSKTEAPMTWNEPLNEPDNVQLDLDVTGIREESKPSSLMPLSEERYSESDPGYYDHFFDYSPNAPIASNDPGMLVSMLRNFRSLMDEVRSLRAENSRLTDNNERYMAKIDDLSRRYEDLSRRFELLSQRYGELEHENRRLQDELREFDAAAPEIRDIIKEAESLRKDSTGSNVVPFRRTRTSSRPYRIAA